MKKMFLLMLLTCFSIVNADYKPVEGKIMTRWGKSMTPDKAWQEYPRPNLQRDDWQNLNGLWEYAITSVNSPVPSTMEGQILVPFCIESALSGVGKTVESDQKLWYRRSFTIPADWRNQRILLHFGAVDYECTLWINGAVVGSHTGGSDPFSFDITDYLKSGQNELQLSVWDPTTDGEQPRGKQVMNPRGIWYTPVTGIWQTVWLEPVPDPLYMEEVRITPNIDESAAKIEVLLNRHCGDNIGVKVTASDNGKQTASAVFRANRMGILKINNPQLWSPDNPFLYDLKIELVKIKNPIDEKRKQDERFNIPRYGQAERDLFADAEVVGNPIDTLKSYLAMRKISLGKGHIPDQPFLCLNNQPLFHNGTLDQGWWPDGLLTPPSDGAMIFELEFLKESGFNMLRKHIKVEPARYYYHCDRLGLLVWQDMPSGFLNDQNTRGDSQGEPLRRSAAKELFELELRRMINRLYNHPSIVMWVVHNEGWGQYDNVRLTNWVKALDPSRIVNAASGWLDRGAGEVYDIHTYGVVPASPKPDPKRAIVVGEYGGIGWPVKDHLWDPEKRNWGYQTYHSQKELEDAYRVKFNAIIQQKYKLALSGAVYTQTTDVEGEVNGLITYDREMIKLQPKTLAQIHRRVYLPAPKTETVLPHAGQKKMQWKYTTSQPDSKWMAPDFDDAGWKTGTPGFGTPETPNSIVNTQWNTSDIWIRTDFQAPSGSDAEWMLALFHDEDAEVYINGVPAAKLTGWTTGYIDIPISPDAAKAVKKGKNTIAIHCKQTDGGQYIDAGIYRLID